VTIIILGQPHIYDIIRSNFVHIMQCFALSSKLSFTLIILYWLKQHHPLTIHDIKPRLIKTVAHTDVGRFTESYFEIVDNSVLTQRSDIHKE
jgi:hypothetical protein